MNYAKTLLILFCFSLCASVFAEEIVFSSDFESETRRWLLASGADIDIGNARSGTNSIKVENQTSIRTGNMVTESGTMELWVRTSSPITHYTINVLTNSAPTDDTRWVQIATIEGSNNDTGYHAKRVSIDDIGKVYIRLDIATVNGSVYIDDIKVGRILLASALQKSRQMTMEEALAKWREHQRYDQQSLALKTLALHYTAQIEQQRQLILYSDKFYSTLSALIDEAERNKMANPLRYATFKRAIDDVKKVSSPIQKARLDSLTRSFGDRNSLNKVSADMFAAFSEPFKSIVATTFDRSSHKNSDLSRKAKKFAEKNGLKVYQTAESFLSEIEKDLMLANGLEKDLISTRDDVDKFRDGLKRNLKDYLAYADPGRMVENYQGVLSNDEQIREAALRNINDGLNLQAEALQNRSRSNTQLMQFMLKANDNIDALPDYKDRFNLITSSMLTFYEKFENSVSPNKNPFSAPEDRKAWEMQATIAREYIQKSKLGFKSDFL